MYQVTSYCTDPDCNCLDSRGVIEGYAETREEAETVASTSLYPAVEITPHYPTPLHVEVG